MTELVGESGYEAISSLYFLKFGTFSSLIVDVDTPMENLTVDEQFFPQNADAVLQSLYRSNRTNMASKSGYSQRLTVNIF